MAEPELFLETSEMEAISIINVSTWLATPNVVHEPPPEHATPGADPPSPLVGGRLDALVGRRPSQRTSQPKSKSLMGYRDSESARARSSFAPSPRHALPCMHASVVGFVEASLASSTPAFLVCEK